MGDVITSKVRGCLAGIAAEIHMNGLISEDRAHEYMPHDFDFDDVYDLITLLDTCYFFSPGELEVGNRDGKVVVGLYI